MQGRLKNSRHAPGHAAKAALAKGRGEKANVTQDSIYTDSPTQPEKGPTKPNSPTDWRTRKPAVGTKAAFPRPGCATGVVQGEAYRVMRLVFLRLARHCEGKASCAAGRPPSMQRKTDAFAKMRFQK